MEKTQEKFIRLAKAYCSQCGARQFAFWATDDRRVFLCRRCHTKSR